MSLSDESQAQIPNTALESHKKRAGNPLKDPL